jgi:hypothetical protein
MKFLITFICVIFFSFINGKETAAQIRRPDDVTTNTLNNNIASLLNGSNLKRQNLATDNAGNMTRCMTNAQREVYEEKTRMAKLRSKARKILKGDIPANNRVQRTLFAWPLRMIGDYDMYNCFNLQNYVDQDPDIDPDGDDDTAEDPYVEDYQCNNRTYDSHRGQDINLWPFWWRMMDRNVVMAVAAAPGEIVEIDDGHFDKNCSCTEPPNIIKIEHADGSISSYWHLKKNTITSKVEGDMVEAGEFLGFIGSSGCSSWPHLHFEVRDINNNVIEPFAGSCNVKNASSWWQQQRPYWDPQINRLMTHSTPVNIGKCPGDEVVNARNLFDPGDAVYTGIAFMDGQNGDDAACTLTRPSGLIYDSWTVSLGSTNSRQYWTDVHNLPSGNNGTWMFKVVYRSRTYAHFFSVGCISTQTVGGSINGNSGFIVGDNLTSTAVHSGGANSRVLYQSASEIELKPGFEASASSGLHFRARIKACSYTD